MIWLRTFYSLFVDPKRLSSVALIRRRRMVLRMSPKWLRELVSNKNDPYDFDVPAPQPTAWIMVGYTCTSALGGERCMHPKFCRSCTELGYESNESYRAAKRSLKVVA